MPIYTFEIDGFDERFEEYFATFADAKKYEAEEGVIRMVPSVPAPFRFANPEITAAAEKGLVPYERGMKEDAKRAKADRERQADEERKRSIAATLADF